MTRDTGLITAAEYDWLRDRARGIGFSEPGPRSDCLAVGCNDGRGSVEAILEGLEYDTLWCVDVWGDDWSKDEWPGDATYAAFRRRVAGKRVRAFRMTSDAFFASLGPSVTFKLIFVDADHSYAQALRDFDNAWAHTAPGGLLAGHDFSWESVSAAGMASVPRLGEMAVDTIRYRRKP